ncbi:class I SAM-dependent methyltransferase [Psychrobacillus sp. FSL H8-0484]|uniref:class I SAM-dependent methyltransferase n=1 Tax=Psychrobacillus sp. FSL H8-0484 TaxID=2921390 RepID=UPI0030FC725F
MNGIELKNRWLDEERKSFKGWDFSHLNGRWGEEELPWDYKEVIMKYLKPEQKLLDMGTGGGEFLLALGHAYENTAVTEAWEPNVKLCQNTLEPLGICVKQVFEDDQLPFNDNAFDIIINRHESYDVREVKRILKKDGLFITQQVGGKNNEFLSKALIPDFKPLYPDLLLRIETEVFITEGFSILLQKEYFPYLRFFDVGAIVFYAKIMEWEFPGFSVENCFERLFELQKKLSKQGYLESFEHRFIIVAQNI